MLLILGAVLVRVGLLQTAHGDSLRNAATEQWTRDRVLPAQRGAIFDRNGDELALSVPASTVAVNPHQVEDPSGTADTFARILGLSAERRDELEAAMAARDSGFVYVARQIDDGQASHLAALDLAGVTIYREDRRIVPGGDTARSVIGRTDIDGVGTAGIEKQWNGVLQGTPGELTLEVAPGDRSIPGSERVVQAPVAGVDLILTLDRSVQYAVEQALLRRVVGAAGPGRPGDRHGHRHRRAARDGVRADQRQRGVRDHVRQLLRRRRLRARFGRQGDHHRRRPERADGEAEDGVRGAVAEAVHPARGLAPRLPRPPGRGDGRRADPRRVLQHRHDHGLRDDGLRAPVPLPAGVRDGAEDGAGLPGREPGHPPPVADVGGDREVHRRLRPGCGEQPDPARLGGQRDRQRRRLRGAQAGDGRGRRQGRRAPDPSVAHP